MTFDLLIKNGHLIDPAAGRNGAFDVAIVGDRIASVDHAIPAESAARVIDASGQIVTPGLVDLHTHVYHSVTYWGVSPDPLAAASGVTTWLDAGSAGAYNALGLLDFVIHPAKARLYALLNISAIGLTAPTWELANLNYCDVDLCCRLIDLHRDRLLGVKARMDANTTLGQGVEPLRRARQAADRCLSPLMVHIAGGPPTLSEVLPFLRTGDILTHCFTDQSMRIIDDRGRLLDEVKAAWEAGVIMDVGHGAGSFSFETSEALIQAGYRPDVISSDIHQLSVHGPLFDLPTCMSKFLALGMNLEDVIHATTARPAQVMGLAKEIGSLGVGMLADIALFTLERSNFPFYDVHMNMRCGHELLRNTLTIVGGSELLRLSAPPPAPWIALSDDQRALIARGHTPVDFARRGVA
jgi:dihydroorotase